MAFEFLPEPEEPRAENRVPSPVPSRNPPLTRDLHQNRIKVSVVSLFLFYENLGTVDAGRG